MLVVLNHPGDVLSGNVTMQLAEKQGLKVKMILTHEDISSGPRDKPEERRGLIGFLPVYKVAGAAAEEAAPPSFVQNNEFDFLSASAEFGERAPKGVVDGFAACFG